MEPSSAPWRVIESIEPEPSPADSPQRGRPWLAIAAAGIAVAVAAGAMLLAARPGPSIGIEGAASQGAGTVDEGGTPSSVSASPSLLVVDVGGAVAHPGVYRLAAGSRIGDAIEAAGGYGPRVDAVAADRALNLAAALKDGDEVHVPSRDEAVGSGPDVPAASGGGSGGGGTGSGSGGLVDLNRATAAELDALPGIGPATAARIIAAREQQRFVSVDDLGARKIVGQATLAKIRSLVTVGR